MDSEIRERLELLERKVAILRHRPDPGVTCRGDDRGECFGGNVKEYDDSYKWGWSVCRTCNGKGRVYPPIED